MEYYERRTRPSANRLCTERMEREKYQRHRERLGKVKSTIDTKTPRMYKAPHLRVNRKREVLLEERFTEIERDNRLLLRKMTDILNGPSTVSDRPIRGGVRPSNKSYRQKQLARITEENQAILHRIQASQPTYSSFTWKQEARENKKRVESICYHKRPESARRASSGYGQALPRRRRPASAMPARGSGLSSDYDARLDRARASASAGAGAGAGAGSGVRGVGSGSRSRSKLRPHSAPTYQRSSSAAAAIHTRLEDEELGIVQDDEDIGAPDMAGEFLEAPTRRSSRPQSAKPAYSAWRSEGERAEVARDLYSAIHDVEADVAEAADAEREAEIEAGYSEYAGEGAGAGASDDTDARLFMP